MKTLTMNHLQKNARQCEVVVGMSPDCTKRKGLYESQVRKDDQDVQSIITTIGSMINPFEVESDQLVSPPPVGGGDYRFAP